LSKWTLDEHVFFVLTGPLCAPRPLAEWREQMYPGGTGGLGWWLCGGVHHQRPYVLLKCQKYPGTDQRKSSRNL